ncbi:MAG: hypothetical protein ACI8ZW_000902, partial [Yoonia sp.]
MTRGKFISRRARAGTPPLRISVRGLGSGIERAQALRVTKKAALPFGK